jgi:PleD family two-component response regulator
MSHIAINDSKMGKYIVDLQKSGKLGKITMKGKGADGLEKPIILAVDDSKTQLAQFKNILGMYDVYTCASPLQALELVKGMEVDLILLDLGMPEINGFEFLQHLRQGLSKQNIPVIVVSGNSAEKYINTAKNLGADDFVAKPPDPEILIREIKYQIEKAPKS